jgi:hypothetical protein
MNEHVESLQIDLNSIKEFFEKNIANNTFNQFDSYAINNVNIKYNYLSIQQNTQVLVLNCGETRILIGFLTKWAKDFKKFVFPIRIKGRGFPVLIFASPDFV